MSGRIERRATVGLDRLRTGSATVNLLRFEDPSKVNGWTAAVAVYLPAGLDLYPCTYYVPRDAPTEEVAWAQALDFARRMLGLPQASGVPIA